MARALIRVRLIQQGDGTSCNTGNCQRPAIRMLEVEGSMVVTSLRFCLAHLRELRDVVTEKVG